MPGQYHHRYDVVYRSPLACLGLKMDGACLTALDWLPASSTELPAQSGPAQSVCETLDAYFESATAVQDHDCLFSLRGTEFQRRVWQALQRIPVGLVMTYGELARKLNTGSRAVGQACRSNPVAVLIPCHRVIAANGLGGYMGDKRQLRIKQWLLTHEGVEWQTKTRH
ncbi:MAG: methylated-DNA--[protein]-cysteine S-methyltransferase [Gammaproteobacteria bacterium]